MAGPQYPPPPLLDAGWYPDPTGRFEARYWDGRHWTLHISHYGANGSDPLLVARFDQPWIRWTLRGVLVIVAITFAWRLYDRYRPTDGRDLAADKGVVEASALVRGDVPQRYTSRAADSSVSPLWADEVTEVEACAAFVDSDGQLADQPRDAKSYGDAGSSLSNALVITGGVGAAGDYLALMGGEDAGSCLASLWATHLSAARPSATVEALTARDRGAASYGDEARWWRLSSTLTGGAFPLQLTADVLVVRVDRVISEYVFESVGSPTGVEVERELITDHVARIRTALARVDGLTEEDAVGGVLGG